MIPTFSCNLTPVDGNPDYKILSKAAFPILAIKHVDPNLVTSSNDLIRPTLFSKLALKHVGPNPMTDLDLHCFQN